MRLIGVDLEKFIQYANGFAHGDEKLPFGGLKKDAPEEAKKEYEKFCKLKAEMTAIGAK